MARPSPPTLRHPPHLRAPLLVVGLLGSFFLEGCKGRTTGDAAEATKGQETAGTYETVDAGVTSPDGSAAPESLKVYALVSPTPISNVPDNPPRAPSKASEEKAGVMRIGYLRKGASVTVKPKVLKKSSCSEGWYELIGGGYVCGKFVTLDPQNKELADAPHAPFQDRALPYDYAINLTNGTPQYRRLPLRKERNDAEKGLAVGKAKGSEKGSEKGSDAVRAVSHTDSETPWYLQDHKGARPQVTFDELKGESKLIDQRMVRGFYIAIDREVRSFSGKLFRTTKGNFVPADHILVHKPATEFEGVWVGKEEEPRKLPLAWVLGLHAREYFPGEDRVKRGEKVPRFAIASLTGQRKIFDLRAYFETRDGWWVRDWDTTIATPMAPPSNIGPNDKWIEVNLKTQTLIAYEGPRPVYATIVSTGRHDDNDKAKDHRTVTGTFHIREKHIAATMDDDGASDGPYMIQDVPWIQYFQGSFALHGAFWHSSFGHERSHGCVNLTPHDARVLFDWTGPRVPDGWHGVRASDGNPGTTVIVHE